MQTTYFTETLKSPHLSERAQATSDLSHRDSQQNRIHLRKLIQEPVPEPRGIQKIEKLPAQGTPQLQQSALLQSLAYDLWEKIEFATPLGVVRWSCLKL
ncbi:MAG: hypothetical protein ACI8T1_005241 [Verrucomicrobiales bacterium]|jgi:hypothetical protein